MPPNGRCVTRPGVFGNPFTVAAAREAGYRGTDGELAWWCVQMFREWLAGRPRTWDGPVADRRRAQILERLPELRGLDLYCFCPVGSPCHADVLLELANREG
jgi:hypothetical protein